MIPFKLHKTSRYFFSLILPQLILGWLFYSAFNSPEGNLFNFTTIAIYWGFLILLFSVLIVLEVNQLSKAWILPVAIIVCYTVLLFVLYESNILYQIPPIRSSSINYEIISLYLTIPAMFHAIIDIIFKYFKPNGSKAENTQNFALSVIIPLFLYIIGTVLIPMFNGPSGGYLRLETFIMKIALCIAITTFLFFFFRFILGNLVGKNQQKYSPLLLIFFGFVLPYIGLVISLQFKYFGSFNYPLIYIAIAVNAIGLGLLLNTDTFLKLIGFLLASIGLPVVIYFFIVFLPYIPLSFVALLFLGAGLLLLTPIVLMILQYQIMSRQFPIVCQKYGKKKLITWSFICISILPICFVGFCIDHRNYLNEIIAETDQFDASDRSYKDYDVEKLQYILEQMPKEKSKFSVIQSKNRLPLLSILYDWYVFDNLQVSTKKRTEIKHLFFGQKLFDWNNYNPPLKANSTLTYTYNTEYVAKDDFYKTQVDLAITNLDDRGMLEFQSEFTLPKDVFITDYYLDIEGRRTYGILAEKKAANWIYNRITARLLDPGILQYLYDGVLSLKIFPFGKKETRTSGFTLYHRTPVHFSINDTPIAIDVKPLAQNIVELSENSFYIPTGAKKNLSKASAPVDYYFVVDNTTIGAEFRKQFEEDFRGLSPENQKKANVLYVDVAINWGTPTRAKESAFNYQKAIKQIQYLHRDQKRIPYVIVYAPYENRFNGKFLSLELEKAFSYDNLVECSHWNKKLPETIELLAFPKNEETYFIRDDGQPSLISLDKTATLDRDFSGNPFLNALQLRLFHDLNDLNPKRKKDHWIRALRESFSQNILTHSTTFISLETKEQEARLKNLQKDIMEKDYAEKAGTETRRMSEPYFWVLLLFISYMLRRQFYKSKHNLKV